MRSGNDAGDLFCLTRRSGPPNTGTGIGRRNPSGNGTCTNLWRLDDQDFSDGIPPASWHRRGCETTSRARHAFPIRLPPRRGARELMTFSIASLPS
jgi:hypothetical protein